MPPKKTRKRKTFKDIFKTGFKTGIFSMPVSKKKKRKPKMCKKK